MAERLYKMPRRKPSNESPAAVSVNCPVSMDFPIAIVLGGMAVANGDV